MGKKNAIQPTSSALIRADIDEQESLIREKAYYKFLERGSQHGSSLEDWLWAEATLFLKPGVRFSEEGETMIAELDLPGLSLEDVQVKTDGRTVIVCTAVPTELRLFSTFEFPRQTNKDGVRVEYREGTLRIAGSSKRARGTLQMSA
jgi:HSP20 family molecular chaperone IbpA